MRYLVTGGAGFIGSHLAAELRRRDHEVVVLDDLSTGRADRVPAGADLVTGSICDAALVERVFSDFRPEVVFHFAAFAAEGISHAVKRFNYETNVVGSVTLLNAAVNHETGFFGFASTVAVYGAGRAPMAESDIPTPEDSYAIGKFAVEQELAVTMRTQGLPYAAVRLHNVYGEWQNMRDPYRNAVAIFLNQILRGEPISVYGDGGQVRAFTLIDDIAPVIAGLPEQPKAVGRVFNIGARQTYSVLELAHAVREAMGVPDHPIVHLPGRDEVRIAYTDTTLGRTELGEWPETPLAVGLKKTADWARSQGPQDLQRTVRPEVGEGKLPDWALLVENRFTPEAGDQA